MAAVENLNFVGLCHISGEADTARTKDAALLIEFYQRSEVEGLEAARLLAQRIPAVVARMTNGRGARLTITNHPLGGAVFSGPQIQPWTCQDGARDRQCNQPPTFECLDRMEERGGDPDGAGHDAAGGGDQVDVRDHSRPRVTRQDQQRPMLCLAQVNTAAGPGPSYVTECPAVMQRSLRGR